MMDPSGGSHNEPGLCNQQTAMAGPGVYNPMMIGGYNSNPGSVEGLSVQCDICLLYTSDAADDMQCVDLGGRRIIKKVL